MKWYGAQMRDVSMGKPTKNEFAGDNPKKIRKQIFINSFSMIEKKRRFMARCIGVFFSI
jgi:hypothetical protein